MTRTPTEAEILTIATHRDFTVHKYNYRHEKLRKLTRRMAQDGKLTMVMYDGKQFYYRTPSAVDTKEQGAAV
jgi:hypothetical protein